VNGTGFRNVLAVFLSGILVLATSGCAARNVFAPTPPLAPAVFKPMQTALLEPYEDLFHTAPKLEFSKTQIERMREYLDQARKHCVMRFESDADRLGNDMREAQSDLRLLSRSQDEVHRKELRCRIQNLRFETICPLPET
jgi:hypothetical protein